MTNRTTDKPCTCHPDEAPVPCQHKYAFSECVAAYEANNRQTYGTYSWWREWLAKQDVKYD